MPHKPSIAIIGGGPAALMLACSLDPEKYAVSIYEKNAALGRKFLVAGKGGFNLTHSEELQQFADRYTPKAFMEAFLQTFSNASFRLWLLSIGIDTYVGTSKRVFPVKGIRPIDVLKAIEAQLQKYQVEVHYKHTWKGWKDEALLFGHDGHERLVKPDITVFALGGASWKVTGSDGSWANYFSEKGVSINPFYPSNCAYRIDWDKTFIQKHAGSALKNCLFSCGDVKRKGEAILTEFGIEGSGVYPLSPAIRYGLADTQQVHLSIDLKPDLSLAEITERLEHNRNSSVKDVLEKKLNLSSVQIDLLKLHTNKEDYHRPDMLAAVIKNLALTVRGLAPIDDAISTVGGIAREELNEHLELTKMPQHYCIGEMIDWDAPTGGYLLQACFSMGYALAKQLNAAPDLEGFKNLPGQVI